MKLDILWIRSDMDLQPVDIFADHRIHYATTPHSALDQLEEGQQYDCVIASLEDDRYKSRLQIGDYSESTARGLRTGFAVTKIIRRSGFGLPVILFSESEPNAEKIENAYLAGGAGLCIVLDRNRPNKIKKMLAKLYEGYINLKPIRQLVFDSIKKTSELIAQPGNWPGSESLSLCAWLALVPELLSFTDTQANRLVKVFLAPSLV